MTAVIKTYGINGLLEWHGYIESNGVKMKVDFTGGTTTAYGVSPAIFTTKDPLTQHIIENSNKFKSGRIRLVRSAELTGEKQPASGNQRTTANSQQPADNGQQPSDKKEAAEVRTITVADKTEAIEWLKENYPEKNYLATNLRTKQAFDAACTECGVQFEF